MQATWPQQSKESFPQRFHPQVPSRAAARTIKIQNQLCTRTYCENTPKIRAISQTKEMGGLDVRMRA